MRHETRAMEVSVRELTDGRNIRESVSMEMHGAVGESDKEEFRWLPFAKIKTVGVFLLGKENRGLRDQEIYSVIDEDKSPLAGHPCGLLQSAFGCIDIEHRRVIRTQIRARNKN